MSKGLYVTPDTVARELIANALWQLSCGRAATEQAIKDLDAFEKKHPVDGAWWLPTFQRIRDLGQRLLEAE